MNCNQNENDTKMNVNLNFKVFFLNYVNFAKIYSYFIYGNTNHYKVNKIEQTKMFV